MAKYRLQAFKTDTLAAQLLNTAGVGDTFSLTSGSFTNDTEAILTFEPKVAGKKEFIKCSINSTTGTIIERGLDGTSAVTHEAGAVVIMSMTPTHYAEVADAVETIPGDDGWINPAATHTYASGTTITIPAGGLTKYSVGDKYKCTQSVPLTSYWNMDGNSTDTKGSNNGTDTNMSYTATGTKFTQHAVFNGISSAIAITDAANLKPTTAPWSMIGWVKPTAGTTVQMVFHSFSDNTNANGIRVYVDTDEKVGVDIGYNATGPSTAVKGSTVLTDAWHMIVVSVQGNFAKIFVDGVLDGSGYVPTPTYAATNYVRIGCGNDAGTNIHFFKGGIDDLAFINGFAVDAAWVAAKYAEGTAQTNANITATQYFNVVSPITDTLLTLAGGADYVLYNGTISNPYYSKGNAVGFPGAFNYAPACAPGAGTRTGAADIGRFWLKERMVYLTTQSTYTQASANTVSLKVPYPISPNAQAIVRCYGSATVGASDFGTYGSQDATYIYIYKYDSSAAFVSGSACSVKMNAFYEI